MGEQRPASIEAIYERLANVREDVSEIKCTVGEIDKRQRGIIIAVAKVEDHDKRLERAEQEIKALWESVKPIIFMSKILSVIGTILAGSVIALIWSILTHQITFIIP